MTAIIKSDNFYTAQEVIYTLLKCRLVEARA